MLDLARERSAGAHTYFVPVEHTRTARERLGPGKLLAPEVACVVETDPARARAVARDYAKLYLGLSNYTQNLLDLGFTEADIAGGGSDRLIDAVIPHGSAGGDRARSSARTSTRAPTTSACSRSASRASRASPGRRSRRP